MSRLSFITTLITVCCLNKLAVIGTNSIRKDMVKFELVSESIAKGMAFGAIRTLVQEDS